MRVLAMNHNKKLLYLKARIFFETVTEPSGYIPNETQRLLNLMYSVGWVTLRKHAYSNILKSLQPKKDFFFI